MAAKEIINGTVKFNLRDFHLEQNLCYFFDDKFSDHFLLELIVEYRRFNRCQCDWLGEKYINITRSCFLSEINLEIELLKIVTNNCNQIQQSIISNSTRSRLNKSKRISSHVSLIYPIRIISQYTLKQDQTESNNKTPSLFPN